MTKDLKRYTDEEKKFAEEVFGLLHNSFDNSIKEDEELRKRWIRYYHL